MAVITMTRATDAPAARPTRRAFNRGHHTFHTEEIEVAKQLHTAMLLVHGEVKARRLLRRDAAAAFRPFRYGRRWIGIDPTDPCVCTMVDRGPFLTGKAGNDHIIVPGRRGWREVATKVRYLIGSPRWAEGFTATAEALDDLGYAVAESIAAMLCWRIESDELVAIYAANPSRAIEAE
jgi:hypothetical protein